MLKRDKGACQICLVKFKNEELEIDHIYPHSLGGSNMSLNLMAVCTKCNQDKGMRLEFYKGEGKEKIKENIINMVKSLPMIEDFQLWLKTIGDNRGRSKSN